MKADIGTLSEHIVLTFRTHTPLGRVIWIVASASAMAGLTYHIIELGKSRK